MCVCVMQGSLPGNPYGEVAKFGWLCLEKLEGSGAVCDTWNHLEATVCNGIRCKSKRPTEATKRLEKKNFEFDAASFWRLYSAAMWEKANSISSLS